MTFDHLRTLAILFLVARLQLRDALLAEQIRDFAIGPACALAVAQHAHLLDRRNNFPVDDAMSIRVKTFQFFD